MHDDLALDIERLRRLKNLLDDALALPEDERAGWLTTLAPADRPLAPSLSAMLARAAKETDNFLNEPLNLGLGDLDAADALSDRAGDEVGPYRLIRELGAGGMADVWLAERADGVLDRQVALKLPRTGWAQGWRQRMARERNLLGALEHPHIARLYDAGVTAAGRPWLAMEWVKGLPIGEHCEAQGCALRERLHLFLQVAEAVAHAHARLIVHRDLKPSNILVTPAGQASLLDFGVAKMLEDHQHPSADPTQVGGKALTPGYASPEQVGGRPLTVATDVYSLAVVLYELLTGERPYKLDRASGAALEEAILAAVVPLASRRAAAAGVHGAWARQLRGDLDNILAKALRKEPDQRYPSVEAFAGDVRRYLEGLPDLAQPDSRRYRLRKFIGRNGFGVALSVAVLLSLAAGLGIAAWQAHAAARQGQLAKARFKQTAAALQFTQLVLTDGIRIDETLTLDKLMQRAEAMARSPEVAKRLAGAHAAQVVATWYMASGMNDRAEKLLSSALASPQAGVDPGFVDDLRCSRALARANMGRVAEALPEFDAVIAGVRDTEPYTAMKCLQARANALGEANDLRGSLRDIREALRQYERIGVDMDETLADLKSFLGAALMRRGLPAQGLQAFAESAALLDAAGAADGATALDLHNNWGLALDSAGNPSLALEHLERTIAISAHRSPTGQNAPVTIVNRAHSLAVLGRFEDCIASTDLALGMLADGDEPSARVYAMSHQVRCLVGLGRQAEAERLAQKAASITRAAGMPDTATSVKWLHYANAQLHWSQGRLDEADAELAALQAVYENVNAKTNLLDLVRLARSEIAGQQGRWQRAQELASQALEIARTNQGSLEYSANTGQALLALAQAQARTGQAGPARASCAQALVNLAPTLGESHAATRQARRLAAELA